MANWWESPPYRRPAAPARWGRPAPPDDPKRKPPLDWQAETAAIRDTQSSSRQCPYRNHPRKSIGSGL